MRCGFETLRILKEVFALKVPNIYDLTELKLSGGRS
jgi:hypothetical protein